MSAAPERDRPAVDPWPPLCGERSSELFLLDARAVTSKAAWTMPDRR
jgi:hypothetical protein